MEGGELGFAALYFVCPITAMLDGIRGKPIGRLASLIRLQETHV
jgi:hypothetical protein